MHTQVKPHLLHHLGPNDTPTTLRAPLDYEACMTGRTVRGGALNPSAGHTRPPPLPDHAHRAPPLSPPPPPLCRDVIKVPPCPIRSPWTCSPVRPSWNTSIQHSALQIDLLPKTGHRLSYVMLMSLCSAREISVAAPSVLMTRCILRRSIREEAGMVEEVAGVIGKVE